MVSVGVESALRHRLLQQFQVADAARVEPKRAPAADLRAAEAPAGWEHLSESKRGDMEDVPSPSRYRNQNPEILEALYGDETGEEAASIRQRTQATLDKMTRGQRREAAEAMRGETGIGPEIQAIIGGAKTFEDAIMAIMMHVAQEEQGKVMRRLRNFEKTTTGVGRFMRDQAANVAEFGGGMVGQFLGGENGATLGRQVGKSAADSALGGEQSRQLEFEKIKFMMQKLNEMVSCISNVLNIMHTTAQATIQNTRG